MAAKMAAKMVAKMAAMMATRENKKMLYFQTKSSKNNKIQIIIKVNKIWLNSKVKEAVESKYEEW